MEPCSKKKKILSESNCEPRTLQQAESPSQCVKDSNICRLRRTQPIQTHEPLPRSRIPAPSREIKTKPEEQRHRGKRTGHGYTKNKHTRPCRSECKCQKHCQEKKKNPDKLQKWETRKRGTRKHKNMNHLIPPGEESANLSQFEDLAKNIV